MPDHRHRVAVDIQALQTWSSSGRGIGRYVHGQIAALVSEHTDRIHSLLINPDHPITAEVGEFLPTGLVREHSLDPPVDAAGRPPTIYYMTSPFEWDFAIDEVWPPWARRRPIQTAATLYDLIPLIYPEQYFAGLIVPSSYWARLELLRQADALLCISKTTGSDARRLLGIDARKIATIGAGVSGRFEARVRSELPRGSSIAGAHGVRTPYIMYTGGLDYRKNLSGLLRAFALLPEPIRSTFQLVVVLRVTDEQKEALGAEAASLDIADRVIFTGFVPDATLATLYREASLFVFPSLYEGFGLPIAEAIMSGTLAVVSDSSSMIDLVTDPDFRFDPTDPADMSRCIAGALAAPVDARLAQFDHISSRFTWGETAKRTMEAIGHLPVEPHSLSSGDDRFAPRARLAVFSPLPPDESGIADYTWRLAGALGTYIDVDLVTVDGTQRRLDTPSGVDLIGYENFLFRNRLRPYADVLYAMGNSDHHGDAFELMAMHPGSVLLHEARFTGFFSWYYNDRGFGPARFHRALHDEYPHLDPAIGVDGWVPVGTAADHDIYLVGPIVDRATRILTTSSYTADLVEHERPHRSTDITNVGFGYPGVESVTRDRPVRWLATFGRQALIKGTDTVLGAFLLLADEFPDLRLAIVGSVDPDLLEELQATVADAGMETRVMMTGRVDALQYEAWLQRATVAVQLRRATNGEVSAAVGDCLSAGIPTIVSDIGSARELPSTAVVKVPAPIGDRSLAAAIRPLLADSKKHAALSRSAVAFARDNAFDAAANRLLAAIGLRPERPT